MKTNLKFWRDSSSLIIAAKSNFNQSPNFNYKLLCLKRSSKAGFMPDNYVFPGGVLCESDANILWSNIFEKFGYKLDSFKQLYPTQNVPPIFQNEVKNHLPKYLSLRICAIRETFEECGILVCRSGNIRYTNSGTNWSSYVGGHEILKWQRKVHNDPNEFLNLCSQLEIYPDIWSLQNWSNWKTPAFVPRGFDTMFFFSSFHQLPCVNWDEKEIQDIKWATPDEYITESLNKKLVLPTPQFYEISRMRNFSDINSLSTYAHERARYGCEHYFPYRIATREGIYFIFPGDELYSGYVDKDDTNMPFVNDLPQCRAQNRILLEDKYPVKLFTQNFVPQDKHLLPIN